MIYDIYSFFNKLEYQQVRTNSGTCYRENNWAAELEDSKDVQEILLFLSLWSQEMKSEGAWALNSFHPATPRSKANTYICLNTFVGRHFSALLSTLVGQSVISITFTHWVPTLLSVSLECSLGKTFLSLPNKCLMTTTNVLWLQQAICWHRKCKHR
jgi:hypothetical protein